MNFFPKTWSVYKNEKPAVKSDSALLSESHLKSYRSILLGEISNVVNERSRQILIESLFDHIAEMNKREEFLIRELTLTWKNDHASGRCWSGCQSEAEHVERDIEVMRVVGSAK